MLSIHVVLYTISLGLYRSRSICNDTLLEQEPIFHLVGKDQSFPEVCKCMHAMMYDILNPFIEMKIYCSLPFKKNRDEVWHLTDAWGKAADGSHYFSTAKRSLPVNLRGTVLHKQSYMEAQSNMHFKVFLNLDTFPGHTICFNCL